MSALDENPNCEYTHATFRLGGDDLQPEVVEQRTGLTGDFGAARNTIRSRRPGHAVRQRTGVWFITTEHKIASTSLERHLIYLLERVEPATRELLAVVDEQRLEADFYCYWVSATGEGGPGVSPATLGRIAALGAELSFEFHGPWGDDLTHY